VPIATGENLHTLHEFTQMIAAGGVTFPEPDVTNCGGITVFMKVAHLAEAFNLPLTSHGAHDLTVHLLAAVPNRSYLEVLASGWTAISGSPSQLLKATRLRRTAQATVWHSTGKRCRRCESWAPMADVPVRRALRSVGAHLAGGEGENKKTQARRSSTSAWFHQKPSVVCKPQ
jgi:hypothetical protein